jgi:glutathione S-transferase
VFHIAERHAGLLPEDASARARAITWMFAALNTVEPPILDRAIATLLERDKPWHEERLSLVDERLRVRLGDLLMVTVLRRLSGSGVLDEYPDLCAYIARCEARPAYQRAFADQLAVFTGTRPLSRRRTDGR